MAWVEITHHKQLLRVYFCVERKWKAGDVVEVHFDMPVRTVSANPQVAEDRSKIAVERGPLVYCAEWADNSHNVLNTILDPSASFNTVGMVMNVEGRDYGMTAIETKALEDYSGNRANAREVSLKLIPYYAWAHRGNGNMEVWMTSSVPAAQRRGRR